MGKKKQQRAQQRRRAQRQQFVLKTLFTDCKFDFHMLPLLVGFVSDVNAIIQLIPMRLIQLKFLTGLLVGVEWLLASLLGGGDNHQPIQVRSVVSRGIRASIHGDMDGLVSIQDLESRLTSLSASVQENGEEILGTLMFSSGQRGPLTLGSSTYSYV